MARIVPNQVENHEEIRHHKTTYTQNTGDRLALRSVGRFSSTVTGRETVDVSCFFTWVLVPCVVDHLLHLAHQKNVLLHTFFVCSSPSFGATLFQFFFFSVLFFPYRSFCEDNRVQNAPCHRNYSK